MIYQKGHLLASILIVLLTFSCKPSVLTNNKSKLQGSWYREPIDVYSPQTNETWTFTEDQIMIKNRDTNILLWEPTMVYTDTLNYSLQSGWSVRVNGLGDCNFDAFNMTDSLRNVYELYCDSIAPISWRLLTLTNEKLVLYNKFNCKGCTEESDKVVSISFVKAY